MVLVTTTSVERPRVMETQVRFAEAEEAMSQCQQAGV
jgi:hypothetical protein